MPNSVSFEKIFKLGDGRFALTEDYEKMLDIYPKLDIEEQLNEFIKNTKKSTIELENIEYDISISVSYTYGKSNLYENAKHGIEKALSGTQSLIFANNLINEAQKIAQKKYRNNSNGKKSFR